MTIKALLTGEPATPMTHDEAMAMPIEVRDDGMDTLSCVKSFEAELETIGVDISLTDRLERVTDEDHFSAELEAKGWTVMRGWTDTDELNDLFYLVRR